MYMYVCAHLLVCIHTCACRCPQRPEDIGFPGPGVLGGCESSDVGVEFRPSCRSTCSKLLSHPQAGLSSFRTDSLLFSLWHLKLQADHAETLGFQYSPGSNGSRSAKPVLPRAGSDVSTSQCVYISVCLHWRLMLCLWTHIHSPTRVSCFSNGKLVCLSGWGIKQHVGNAWRVARIRRNQPDAWWILCTTMLYDKVSF